MRIVFVSNFFNHHQAAVSKELNLLTKNNYYFIQTEPFSDERKKLGWKNDDTPDYVLESFTSKEAFESCRKIINSADVLIYGGCKHENLISEYKKSGKLLLRYSERIYKNIKNVLTLPLRFLKYHAMNLHCKKNTFMLCSSAYAAADYAKTRNFINRTYNWGYFPATQYYNIEQLLSKKKKNLILWVARLIPWKHPEYCIELANYLKNAGYEFEIKIIGNGELIEELECECQNKNLGKNISFLGTMSPNEVRSHMEEAGIFIFTSDFNEGWGVVLNEAMNSGCAVVASHAIGAVPLLIENDINGLIYKYGDINDFCSKVKYLMDHPSKQDEFGEKAYKSICELWNAKVAATRLYQFAESFCSGQKYTPPRVGPMSISTRLSIIGINEFLNRLLLGEKK